MMHIEIKQMKEENEYQRRLGETELRKQAIDMEVSMLRLDIGSEGKAARFVHDWIDNPPEILADIITKSVLHNRTQTKELGEWLQTVVNDKLYQAAEIIIDWRRKK